MIECELIMSSKELMRNSSRNLLFGLIVDNVVGRNVAAERREAIRLGSLVILERDGEQKDHAIVRLMNLENISYSCEDRIFVCPANALLLIQYEAWGLLAGVPSPEDRIRIAKDVKLLEELSKIDIGKKVQVIRSSASGIVVYKGPVKKLGPGILFQVMLDTNNETVLPGNRPLEYYSANELRLKSKNPHMVSKSDFKVLTDHCMSVENEKDDERLNSDARKIKKFKPGERVMWVSETKEQRATVCWVNSYDAITRVHLGNSSCKMASCDRSLTKILPASQLFTEYEYQKLKKTNSNTHNRLQSTSLDESKFDGLLDSDQLDGCNMLKNSYQNTESDVGEEARLYKPEISSSRYNSKKLENSDLSNENSNSDDLGVGSVVEVSMGGESYYGVIKWIGPFPCAPYGRKMNEHLIAGIEMEEENDLFEHGYLSGKKYFDCAPHRGHFAMLKACKKDSRFQDFSYSCADETKTPENLGRAVIPGIIEPIDPAEDVTSLYGKFKGIQGHNNSCYLDATLFSMFTFTNVFDSLLYRPANTSDSTSYDDVQRVLREEIVNPLRTNLFVRAERVMKLRTLLDNLTSVTGLTCEEKDPEEFLTSLVAQVLKAEPFLKLSSGHEAYYYQLFVEKDERLKLPTVQQLFDQSLITSDIKLKEVPSCLIIQMPRFGKNFKMYPRILPSPILDVTDVIENSPRQCSVCFSLAKFECKECFEEFETLQCFSFCEKCALTIHHHDGRVHHKYTAISVPLVFGQSDHTISRHFMELFAVLCIETSHYVAFVKCGFGPDAPWCFFDSMADRKGGSNGFNIPEVVLCPEIPEWLSDDGAKSLNEVRDDRHLPPYPRRLLCDAYMCMYQSTDVMKYR